MAGVHGDMTRRIYAKMERNIGETNSTFAGAFAPAVYQTRTSYSGTPYLGLGDLVLDTALATPTGNANKGRSYGVNGCVWFGLAS